MPRNSSAARRRDARILTRLDETGHRAALQHLDGVHGDNEADRATALVKIVEAAVRARRSAVGGSRSEALEKVLQGNTSELADELFPVVNEPADRWQLLSGVHITLDRHSSDLSQYLTGIVLGVEWHHTSPTLRVVLTAPALGKPTGDVASIVATRWRISPSPADIAATASRETHCEAGRPLYRDGEFPPSVLATLATLNLMRLRPTVLQGPVASLRDSSGNTPALYAVADAEEIPTSARNAAANARRRICVTCGAKSPTPFPAAKDGRRHCPNHIAEAKQRVADAEKARNRAVSALWAREVIDDPDTVLVAMTAPARDALAVRVETMSGAVLLDNLIDDVPRPNRHGGPSEPDLSKLPDWVFGPDTRALSGRRAVGFSSGSAGFYYRNLLETTHYGRAVFRLDERRGDNLWKRHQVWAGKLDLAGLHELDEAFRSRHGSWNAPESQLADVQREVRTALTTMASTAFTAVQEEYAGRLLRDTEAVEYRSYYFRRNQGSVLTRRLAEAVDIFGS